VIGGNWQKDQYNQGSFIALKNNRSSSLNVQEIKKD
jgi:hypothetical protein